MAYASFRRRALAFLIDFAAFQPYFIIGGILSRILPERIGKNVLYFCAGMGSWANFYNKCILMGRDGQSWGKKAMKFSLVAEGDQARSPRRRAAWMSYRTGSRVDPSSTRENGTATRFEDHGTILEIEPGKLLKTTYFSGSSGLADKPANYNVITCELTPSTDDTTKVTMTQTNNPDQDAADRASANWGMTLTSLKEFLEK